MKSFQVVFHLDTSTVHCVGGSVFVESKNSAAAKKLVKEHFHKFLNNITSLTFDRALQREPDTTRGQAYLTADSPFILG